jgi:hypothetical protein
MQMMAVSEYRHELRLAWKSPVIEDRPFRPISRVLTQQQQQFNS